MTTSAQPSTMFVVNRHGEHEAVKFDKILMRIAGLAEGLHPLVDPSKVAQAVINGMFCGISTSELDNLAAQTCAYMAASHPDFSKLAARISVSNLHKNTSDDFAKVISDLHNYKDKTGRSASLIALDVHQFVQDNADSLNKMLDYSRDLEFDYFAFKTLERSYLLRIDGIVVERPQQLFLRVACGIHCGDLERVQETYELMSRKFFTHATPTLFNSGLPVPQMSSCFLLQMTEDSIAGIFDTLKSCALISKSAGGIGLAIHKIRATGTYIAGTNGRSNGIVPMLRVFNDTARYVDQGGGKRKGSFAIYLEPWHADVFEFLDMRKNHGKEETRARDLFYALWVCDLFMERVQNNQKWTLMCPHLCPGLPEAHGEEFNELYTRYEQEGRGVREVQAQQLWFAILQSQIETGNPFMVYKDSANRKSNQQNLGTIQCSNLCTEIIEFTSPDEIAVCNLASIAIPRFVNIVEEDETSNVNSGDETQNDLAEQLRAESAAASGQNCSTPTKVVKRQFDFKRLYEVTKVVTSNLNRVIDRNHYPVPQTWRSNMRHRPIGIGIQGFADALMLLKLPYESEEAMDLNRKIFETIYFAACERSMELAKKDGHYSTYPGSPASQGLLQFDLWTKERRLKYERLYPQAPSYDEALANGSLPIEFHPVKLSGLWDWDGLKAKIAEFGLRNSLLLAPMPTASTSQILGNCESFEPYTSNIYTRRVLSGEFFVVNPHLLRDLIELGLWNDSMKQRLIASNGSIQGFKELDSRMKQIYKTVWEIKQKTLIDLAVARGPFIDQSQSLNLYVLNPTFAKLSSMHFYAWKCGLKTGMYYLRTQAAVDAIKFTVDKATVQQVKGASRPTDQIQSAGTGDKENNHSADNGAVVAGATTNAVEVSLPRKEMDSSNVVCPRKKKGYVAYGDDEICHACSG